MKKFRITLLTLLLVFQTVINPLASAPAVSPDTTDIGSASTKVIDESAGNKNELETNIPASSDEKTIKDDVVGDSSAQASEEKGDDSSANEEKLINGNQPAASKSVKANLSGPIFAEGAEEFIPKTIVDYKDLQHKSIELKVNGSPVDLNNAVEVKHGQNFKLDIKFDFEQGHEYGTGSKLTFTLPDQLNFPNGSTVIQSGATKIADVQFTNQKVVITFTNAIRDNNNQGTDTEGLFVEVNGTFKAIGDDWNQKVTLPYEEELEIQFVPPNTITDKPVIDKQNGVGDYNNKNSQFITWKATVNQNLGVNVNSGTTTFTDTLPEGQAITFVSGNTVESIKKYTYKPDGTLVNSAGVSVNLATIDIDDKNPKKLEIKLPNELYTYYVIEYKTKVGDPGATAESFTFTNKAEYNGKSDSAEAKVEFGKPLYKSGSGPDANLKATWTIYYNHNTRKITADKAALTDNWTEGHKLVGDFKVYKVKSGHELVGNISGYSINLNDSNQAELVDASKYTFTTPDGCTNCFNLKFNEDITDAYIITYQTEPDAEFPSSNKSVTNTVKREDTGTERTATVEYKTTEFVLNKTNTGVNYKDKKTSWKIVANQYGNYTLAAGTTFEDTFSTLGDSANDELLILDEDSVAVKVGNTDITNEKGTKWTLDSKEVDGKTVGFTITLLEAVNKQKVEITYTTRYPIQLGTNTRTFKNDIEINNTGIGVLNGTTAEAVRTFNTEQKANGYKKGEYNYATKIFTWEVLANYNYKEITNAIFKDELPNTQKVTSMKIKKVQLKADGSVDTTGSEEIANLDEEAVKPYITEEDGKIKINYPLEDINQPILIEYTTTDKNGAYPPNNGSNIKIKNNAQLFEGTTLNAEWDKEITIPNTDQIIKKNGTQLGTSPQMNWKIQFNYAKSNLEGIVIEDEVGKLEVDGEEVPAQIILADTIKVYKVDISGNTTNDPSGPDTSSRTPLNSDEYTVNVDLTNGKFTITGLPDGDAAYDIDYSTVYIGPTSGAELKNKAVVKYTKGEGTEGNDEFKIENFTYNAGGSVSFAKFVVIKKDAVTGKPMEGVKFTLKGPYTGNTALISGKTDENGVLDFNLNLASSANNTKLYTLEEELEGYKKLTHSFELKKDKAEVAGPYKGKQVIEIANEPKTAPSCEKFEIIAKDIDGEPLTNGTTVTLKSKATNISVNYTVNNDNGKLTFKRNSSITGSEPVLTAGEYVVFYGAEEIGEVTVQYNDADCTVEVQPKPSCPNYTITLKDESGNPRANVEVTLKDKSENVVTTATTNSDGEITVSSANLPAGKYDLYEGNLYLDEVTVTYKNGCETEVQPTAPSCPQFTLTAVYDIDGNKLGEGTQIALKVGNDTKASEEIKADGTVTFTNLPAGTYDVYDVTNDELLGTVTTNTKCETEFKPAPSCPTFNIILKDKNGTAREAGVKVKLKNKSTGDVVAEGTTDSNGVVSIPNTTPAGTYDIYEGNLYLDEVTVTYKNGCETEVQPTAPKCPNYTLTSIYDVDGNKIESGKITLKEKGKDNVVAEQDINSGKVTFTDLAPGEYDVYHETEKLGTVKVDTNCGGEFKPKPSCENFTIVLNDEKGQPRKNVTVTLKSKDGKGKEYKVTSNEKGVITISSTTPSGKYDIYEDKMYLTEVNISYKGEECKVVVTPTEAPSCPTFTLTSVYDIDGNKLGQGTVITLKGNGKEYKGTIDKDGKVTFSNDLLDGTYEVYNGTEKLGAVDTNTKCEVDFKPQPTEDLKILLKDKDGNPRSKVKVTLRDEDGNIILETITDENGYIIIPANTPPGKYYVFEGEQLLTNIKVSFKPDTPTEYVQAPSCPKFTLLSIYDANGKQVKKGTVVLKQGGKVIAKANVSKNGQVTFNNLPVGTYDVYIGNVKIGEVTTNIDCELEFKSTYSFSSLRIDAKVLPQTNGETQLIPVVIGFLLASTAIVFLMRRRKVDVQK